MEHSKLRSTKQGSSPRLTALPSRQCPSSPPTGGVWCVEGNCQRLELFNSHAGFFPLPSHFLRQWFSNMKVHYNHWGACENTEDALTLGDSDSARERTGVRVFNRNAKRSSLRGSWITVEHYLTHQSVLSYSSGAPHNSQEAFWLLFFK